MSDEIPAPAADVPPDRLAISPRSPYFDADKLGRGIGIRFKGIERTNVIEYCRSEGWILVQAGKSKDRHGNPMTVKLKGPVEAWFEDSVDDAAAQPTSTLDQDEDGNGKAAEGVAGSD